MHLFCSLMIKNKNHSSTQLYQNYGSFLAEKERFEAKPTRRNSRLAPYRSRYSFSPPISPSLLRPPGALRALCPLENIVVSGVYAVAPTRYSLFSPLSPSLLLAPRAVGLQARAVCFAKRRVERKISTSQKENHPIGWFSFWRRRRDLNSRAG